MLWPYRFVVQAVVVPAVMSLASDGRRAWWPRRVPEGANLLTLDDDEFDDEPGSQPYAFRYAPTLPPSRGGGLSPLAGGINGSTSPAFALPRSKPRKTVRFDV